MSIEVRRFAHDSRVPDWDTAVDLTKDPASVPDPATTPVPADLRAEIEGHMAKYPDRRSAAIPALAAAQNVHGWCSPEAVEQVACVMRLTPAYLTAVATFYDMLDTRPVGRKRVYVCTNISCSLCGGRELLAKLQEELDGDEDVQVRGFECLGACDIAPMASVDGVYVGPIDARDVPDLVRQVRDGTPPLPAKQLIRRPSADPEANTRAWAAAGTDFETAVEELERPAPGGAPLPPEPSAFGPPMGQPAPTDVDPEPVAPQEQAPSPPEEGPSEKEGTP